MHKQGTVCKYTSKKNTLACFEFFVLAFCVFAFLHFAFDQVFCLITLIKCLKCHKSLPTPTECKSSTNLPTNGLTGVLLFIHSQKRMEKIHLPVDGFYPSTRKRSEKGFKKSIYKKMDFIYLPVDGFYPSTTKVLS